MIEIILHGKPYSDSCRQSGGLDDSFVSFFASTFFRESGLLKDLGSNESLIVDARNWKGKWYAVYTFSLRVSDFAGTPGVYFSISAVFQNEYNRFASDVYAILKKTCKEYVEGRYLSKGKYLVRDFEGKDMFDGLVAFIRNNWNTIVETFDNGFVPQNDFRNDVLYNIDDCDSKVFLDEWRKSGRVIITPNTPSKDTLIRNEKNGQNKILLQQQTIDQLRRKLAELQKKESNPIDTSRGQRKEIQLLKDENKRLNEANKRLNDSLEDYCVRIDQFGKEVKTFFESFPRRMADTFPSTDRNKSGHSGDADKRKRRKEWIWMPWIILLVLAFSVATNIVVLHSINNNGNVGNNHVDTDTTNGSVGEQGDSTETDTSTMKSNLQQTEYKINIEGLSHEGKPLIVGRTYTLQLLQKKNGKWDYTDKDKDAKWFVNGIPNDNKLESNEPKDVLISCIVDGVVVERPDNPLKFIRCAPNPQPAPKPKVKSVQEKVEKGKGGEKQEKKEIKEENITKTTKS